MFEHGSVWRTHFTTFLRDIQQVYQQKTLVPYIGTEFWCSQMLGTDQLISGCKHHICIPWQGLSSKLHDAVLRAAVQDLSQYVHELATLSFRKFHWFTVLFIYVQSGKCLPNQKLTELHTSETGSLSDTRPDPKIADSVRNLTWSTLFSSRWPNCLWLSPPMIKCWPSSFRASILTQWPDLVRIIWIN